MKKYILLSVLWFVFGLFNHDICAEEITVEYHVTWDIVWSEIVPCESPEPKCDEYGFCSQSYNTLDIACYETKFKSMEKTFGTIDDAKNFIDNAKVCDEFGHLSGCVKNIKLREVTTEELSGSRFSVEKEQQIYIQE